MSAPAAEAPAAAAADAHGAPAAGGSGKMKLIAIIAVVMLVEGAAMFLLIPRGHAAPGSAEGDGHEHAAAGHDDHGGHGGHGGGHGGHDDGASDSETAEVPIESFMCTNNRASPGSIIHMSFKLSAVVATPQRDAFEKGANADNKARVRQAIIKVARSSNMEEMSDPDLSTMRRLFREEINKVLKKSYVIEVVVSDFKTIEQ